MTTPTTTSGTSARIYGTILGVVALAIAGIIFAPGQAVIIVGFCTVAVSSLFAHLSNITEAERVREEVVVAAQKVAEVKATAEVAAAKVAEVKTTLVESTKSTDAKLDSLAKVAEATHILVNNKMQLALTSIAGLARWKANSTNDPADEKAAIEAEEALSTHKDQQAVVDANSGKVA